MFCRYFSKISAKFILYHFCAKINESMFCRKGKVKVTLCVNLMYNWLFLTTSPVKSVSFREKRLLYMSHFLNQSMVCIYVGITALKRPEVVRKINKNYGQKINR